MNIAFRILRNIKIDNMSNIINIYAAGSDVRSDKNISCSVTNSDADKYAAEKEKADGRFKEAIGYLEEATKVSPEDTKSKTMLSQVQAAMK